MVATEAGLEEFPLGTVGRRYLEDRLGQSLTLGQSVLRDPGVDAFETSTVLPAGTPLSALQSFQWGGVANSVTTFEWLFERLRSSLSAHEDSVLVAENALAGPQVPALKNYKSLYAFLGEEVYHFAQRDVEPTIRSTIREAESAHTLTFLVGSLSSRAQFPRRGEELSVDLLEQIATSTKLVGVAAYDGEGYVLGQRTA
jgi:hypothetical protein